MVNWKDPETIAQGYRSFINLAQISCGIFLWDWLNTLYFDWRLISIDRREWKWPTFVYVLTRITTVANVVTQFTIYNLKAPSRCNVLWHAVMGFGYVGVSLTSTLIAVRIVAIWNRKLWVVLFVTAAVLINVGSLLYTLIRVSDSVWDPVLGGCVVTNTVRDRMNIIITFMADVLMLLVMLLGIWLKRGSGNLWRLVIRQGLIWVLVAIIFTVPLIVLISLNLNDAMNMLFQTPVSVSMTICSTRMHRSLYEFANSGQVVVDVNLGGSCRTSQSTTVRRSPNGGLVPMVHITRTVETDTVKTSQASTLCADV